ncbi:uncharacterized protein LOC128235415 [Mya arenaria]|uniref:uncharacterized protein LOC128235415 n=1 Tax=Mya arenaria TaxID=6604 RepID=UPI0022E24840|nr:uncharacterized protein LOC128235415 [Mya arenaria]XP_052806197.1 uncharacterized protein LOC128235415 [Mya arenaria]
MLNLNRVLAERIHSINAPTEQSQEAYAEWTPTYEQDLKGEGYCSPEVTVKYVCDVIPDESRASTRVLDIGAGTGLVAKLLRERGFMCMDALDPNDTMLREARKHNLYDNYFLEYITSKPTSIQEGTYDVLTGSGIYATDGHVPLGAIIEMIRLVKKGGFIVLVTRFILLAADGPYEQLEPLMKQLEEEGRWRAIHRDVFPRYYRNYEGIAWVFQKV